MEFVKYLYLKKCLILKTDFMVWLISKLIVHHWMDANIKVQFVDKKKSEWDEVQLLSLKGIMISFFWDAIPYGAVECDEYDGGMCKTAGSLMSAFTANTV